MRHYVLRFVRTRAQGVGTETSWSVTKAVGTRLSHTSENTNLTYIRCSYELVIVL